MEKHRRSLEKGRGGGCRDKERERERERKRNDIDGLWLYPI